MNCHSEIVRKNGVLKIKINDKLYAPLSFKSFRANPNNVSEFYNAGVRLFSVLSSGITSALGVPYSLYGESWIGENEYDFSAIDKQMDMFCQNAPEGYFAPMLQLDTRSWYIESHPEIPNSFTNLSQIAGDKEWKIAASDYLKAAIAHIEEKYGERVYGYFLLCGTTTEWFSDCDYENPNSIKNSCYKEWCNDINAELPTIERLNTKGNVFLENDENDVYSARKFHNELIADLILYFSAEAQSVIKRNKLLGVYFGYLFELGGERLYNAGSLAYEKVFLSDDINMISSPSSYAYRKITDPSAFMLTQKTLDRHNKIYFLEFDHRTHLIPERIKEPIDTSSPNCSMKDGVFPGADMKYNNETESVNVMYRDFILCNGNGAALWWFDMFDGWFRSAGMMSAVSKMIKITDDLSLIPTKSVAQIAVFAEGESMYRARKSSNLASICLSDIRRTLAECGAPYDLYTIADIAVASDNRYKLYIFVNQYDIPSETREIIINECKRKGKTVLWLYAPNYANNGNCNIKNISEIIDMNVVLSKKRTAGLIYKDSKYEYPLSAPYFSVCDKNTENVAFYEDGTVAVAQKHINNFTSVYCATCNLPSELLRQIAENAGVFIYAKNPLVYTYANSSAIGVYNACGGDTEIYLLQDGEYYDCICDETLVCTNGVMKIRKRDINAYLLRKK